MNLKMFGGEKKISTNIPQKHDLRLNYFLRKSTILLTFGHFRAKFLKLFKNRISLFSLCSRALARTTLDLTPTPLAELSP